MFENIMKFFKKGNKAIKSGKEEKTSNSKDAAKERLHLVLMQDRANVSADFLELMKQEIIDVIKKYIEVDESAIDVRLTNKENDDGTNGAPALYANIPIVNIKNEVINSKTKSEEKQDDKNNKEERENEQENDISEEKIEIEEKRPEIKEQAEVIIDSASKEEEESKEPVEENETEEIKS